MPPRNTGKAPSRHANKPWRKRDANLGPLTATVRKQVLRLFGEHSPLLEPTSEWVSAIRTKLTNVCISWDTATIERMRALCTARSVKIRSLYERITLSRGGVVTVDDIKACLGTPDDFCKEVESPGLPDQDRTTSNDVPPPSSPTSPSAITAAPATPIQGSVHTTASSRRSTRSQGRTGSPPPRRSRSPATPPPPTRAHYRASAPRLSRHSPSRPAHQEDDEPYPLPSPYAPYPSSPYAQMPSSTQHPYYRHSLADVDSDGEPILTDYYRSLAKVPSVTDRTARRYRYRNAAHWKAAQGW